MPGSHRCTHTRPDHTPCRAFASGRSRLCHWHGRQAARDRRRTRALNRGCTVRIGPLDTRRAILNAVNRVLQPLAAGTLPLHRASSYLRRIHLAVFALNRLPGSENHETTDISHLAQRTLALEPLFSDLLSLIQPPTIEGIPAASASLSTCSPQPVASFEQSRPTRIPKPATPHGPRRTDNATRRTDKASR
jgi:hypothetical protein